MTNSYGRHEITLCQPPENQRTGLWESIVTFHHSEIHKERLAVCRNSCPAPWPSVTFTHNGFIYRRQADYSWCNILLATAETPECWTGVSKGSKRQRCAPTPRGCITETHTLPEITSKTCRYTWIKYEKWQVLNNYGRWPGAQLCTRLSFDWFYCYLCYK